MEPRPNASAQHKNFEHRRRINENILSFQSARQEMHSERAAARRTGIPRSTLQYHAKRQREAGLDKTVDTFFRSPAGMTFLHRLFLAIEFVLSQVGHCGLRLIRLIYELSGLDRLVACSQGAISERVKALETRLIAYGEQEEARLASTMEPGKLITTSQDETFHSGRICLVAIEHVSNYILLEEMTAKRDTATWSEAMDKRLAQLPVKVIQVTSDEAKPLIKYAEQHLGAHHSPDLFHVQQEVSKASAAPLRAKLKKAESTLEQAEAARDAVKKQQAVYESQERKPVGRPVDFDARLAEADVECEFAAQEAKEAENRRDKLREANKALSDSYHPFELETGQKRTPSKLCAELKQNFDAIEAELEQAELSENCLKRVEKARRVTDAMVGTLRFFWAMVRSHVKSLKLDKAVKVLFIDSLLPAVYLELHASKAQKADVKRQRKAIAKQLYEQLDKDLVWRNLTEERRAELKQAALACAHLFQRSSSNVEGRNGQLSLHHHAYKRLGERKLRASTVIHNYFLLRPDGTTAAERFFGQAPQSLFNHLLSVTDYPAAPAKKRSGVRFMDIAA